MNWFLRYEQLVITLVKGVEGDRSVQYWCYSVDGVDSSPPVSQSPLMSAPVHLEGTKRLLSTLSPPSIPPSLLLPSLPPRCRFYELPWALIHLCHTQGPLLGLLTNWLGCRWEGPAGHIWFLQPGQRPASQTRKKYAVIWVWTSQCLQHVC